MKLIRLMLAGIAMMLSSSAAAAAAAPRSPEYAALQQRLQQGWGVWNNASVVSQVLLPYGLEVQLGLKKESTLDRDAFLPTALIGRRGKEDEQVFPGRKTYDGAYSTLRLTWRGIEVRVETAQVDGDMVMLVTPLSLDKGIRRPPTAIFSANMLWNRPGSVERETDRIVARLPSRQIAIHAAGKIVAAPHTPISAAYLAVSLDSPAGVSTGRARSIRDIQGVIARARARVEANDRRAGAAGATRSIIETAMAWNTIYDAENQRIVSPVSRIWNLRWGGFVLFEWDTFFAATLAAASNRDLAYANAMEILNEATPAGMVPNYARGLGQKSADRSQPPVGALTILQLYRRFNDRWILRDSFDRLMVWNAWWLQKRAIGDYLVWGSDPDAPPVNVDDPSPGSLQAAKYESGLDNSPMYDDPVQLDEKTHLMQLADVGLMSVFLADCDALAEMARILGRPADVARLNERAARIRRGLATLWDPATGIYRNKDLRTGRLSPSLSPTNFYPLLAGAPTDAQAKAMIERHLLNPSEFGGKYILPSIARNDPTFEEQFYWRGRIWGPMNYLVWLGLANYTIPAARDARREVGRHSLDLFMEEWRAHGHVHENYSAVGSDHDSIEKGSPNRGTEGATSSSDRFYHWGALLGLIGPGVDPALEAQRAPGR